MRTAIALITLFIYFRGWHILGLRRRILSTMEIRKNLGLFEPNHEFTLTEILDYGRWIASMRFSQWIRRNK